MQRTGRKGLANFRVVVQDARFSPSSGRVVAQLGHYNPHTKEIVLDAEKAATYLANGAQPSPRVVKLLQEQKVALPSWVSAVNTDKKRSVRNPEKLRKNQPKEEPAPVEAEAPAETEVSSEAPAEEKAE
jgi:small subunit ribosomal protein S16